MTPVYTSSKIYLLLNSSLLHENSILGKLMKTLPGLKYQQISCVTINTSTILTVSEVYLLYLIHALTFLDFSDKPPIFRGLFIREPSRRLSSVPSAQLHNSSIEHCASACVRQTNFQCKSFDFNNRGRTCLLFSVNLDDTDVHLIASSDRDHYKSRYSYLCVSV